MTAKKILSFAYLMRKSVESRLIEVGNVLPTEPEKLDKFREEIIPVFYPEYAEITKMISECETEIAHKIAQSAGFEHEDQWITDPSLDPSGRFPLTEEESITTYGKENVEAFLRKLSGIIK